MAKKNGRPTDYNKKIADILCKRIANKESLNKICKDETMPHQSTVYRWLLVEKHEDFRENYRLAREMQVEAYMDESVDLADNAENDFIVTEDGEEKVNNEAIQRSKLRIDTRFRIAGKLLPKKYGDKVQAELSGDIALPNLLATVMAKKDE